jgi:hypothetical protein
MTRCERLSRILFAERFRLHDRVAVLEKQVELLEGELEQREHLRATNSRLANKLNTLLFEQAKKDGLYEAAARSVPHD